MVMQTLDFESGANGDTATLANTGASAIVTTGGALTISTADSPPQGTRQLRSVGTSTSGGSYLERTFTANDDLAFDFDFSFTSLPSAEAYIFFVGTGATRQYAISLLNNGKLTVRNASNAANWISGQTTSTYTLAPGQYRISGFFDQSAGTFRVVIYAADGATVLDDTGVRTGMSLGTTDPDRFRVGSKGTTSTAVFTANFDRVRWDAGATDLLPTIAPPAPDVAAVLGSGYREIAASGMPGAGGTLTYTISPSTDVLEPVEGRFLVPVGATYTITVTESPSGLTDTFEIDVPDAAAAGAEIVLWDGAAWV